MFISHNPQETEALGERWGRIAPAGWILGLIGELGTGKTQLVKGLARGLGVKERVHSPTFALVHEYRSGRLPLFHLDLYRLETTDKILAAGLESYLTEPDGITVVEWAERWPTFAGHVKTGETIPVIPAVAPLFPDSSPCSPLSSTSLSRLVRFEVLNESERCITYEDLGA